MPQTGWLEPLRTGGMSFEQLVLRFAHNFVGGDVPLDHALPNSFTASNETGIKLDQARQRVAEVQAWDDDKATSEAEAAYQAEHEAYVEACRQRYAFAKRLRQLLERVTAWIPPTEDHKGLKDFMKRELEEAIRSSTAYDNRVPSLEFGPTYRQRLLEVAESQVEVQAKALEREQEQAAATTQWVTQLRSSLAEWDNSQPFTETATAGNPEPAGA